MATGDHHVIVIICSWTALPHVLQDILYVLPMVYDSFDSKHVKARGPHGGTPGAAAMPRVAVEVVLSTLSAKAVRDTSAWEVPHKGRATLLFANGSHQLLIHWVGDTHLPHVTEGPTQKHRSICYIRSGKQLNSTKLVGAIAQE